MPQLLDMVTLVAPFAPNVPAFTAANAIRDAARHFFKETFAYQMEVELDAEPGVKKYPLDLFCSDVEIVSTLEIKKANGKPLNHLPKEPEQDVEGSPIGYLGSFDRHVVLYPTPNEAQTLTVKVAVRPRFDAEEIEDSVFGVNAEGLRWGALAILKKQPGTDWFSPAEVGYYEGLFLDAINKRAYEVRLNNMPNNMRLDIPSFN